MRYLGEISGLEVLTCCLWETSCNSHPSMEHRCLIESTINLVPQNLQLDNNSSFFDIIIKDIHKCE